MHVTLGQAIWASVRPIIKIYLIIGVGFLLSKMGILTVEATRTISDVVLTVLLPCLSFNKIVANIEDNDIKQVGIICLTSVILFATGLGFAFIIRKFMPVPKQWHGGILAGGMFPNISDLPIAYLQTMAQGFIFTAEEGEKGVANVIIFLAMFLICVFNLGGFRLIENDFSYYDEENAVRDNESLGSSSSSPSSNNDNIGPTDKEQSSSSNSTVAEEKLAEHQISNKNADPTGEFKTSSDITANDQSDIRQPETAHLNNNLNDFNDRIKIDNKETKKRNDATNNGSTGQLSSEILTTESLPESSISIMTPIHSNATVSDYENNLGLTRRTMSQPVAYTTTEELMYNRHHHNKRTHQTDSTNPNGDNQFNSPNYDLANLDRFNSRMSMRSIDQRDLPLQDMNDIIREYSNVDQFGHKRKSSITSDFSSHSSINTSKSHLQKLRSSNLTKILTSDATVSKKDIQESGSSLPKFIQKFPLTPAIVFFAKNCLRPCSTAVILALTIAFIPWVKALFTTSSNTPKIKQAPDNAPALAFIMDFTAYVGAASVPFGLILLGATLGKLKIGKLYPGFWKSAFVLVFLRQCIMPIFGVLWCDRLVKAGWCSWEHDKMLLFVIAITWNLPTMTTLIYFTASYTPVDCIEPIQMECVSFFLMIQYPLMAVSLPFLVSYFLKVQMKL